MNPKSIAETEDSRELKSGVYVLAFLTPLLPMYPRYERILRNGCIVFCFAAVQYKDV
jgi:hypothetical protein